MGTIPVWYQNQNFLWKCTTKYTDFWPECKTRVSVTISSFGFKAKMSWFSPNNFWISYQFSGSLPCTIQHIKYLEVQFLFWQDMTNSMYGHSQKWWILNVILQHRSFVFIILWKSSKFFIFDYRKSSKETRGSYSSSWTAFAGLIRVCIGRKGKKCGSY